MKRLRTNSINCSPVFILSFLVFISSSLYAGFAGGGPQSGDIYKEFYINMQNNNKDWRVTDPNATNPGSPGNSPGDFLPNPTMYFNLSSFDLQDASKAEAVIDLWGGHVGTTGKKVSFNGNWISIPELSTTPTSGQCYTQQTNVLVSIPLNALKVGSNSMQGTSGGQTCYNFDWGQWGWYGVVIRIYYSSAKPHASGNISYPSSGATINDDPTISANVSGSVNRVDFLAYYDGYDTDGDGVFSDWQRGYHRQSWGNQIGINNHIGTTTSSPWQSNWNTQWVPDQASGAIKILARIRDNNNVWYVTSAVQNITLQRTSFSVRLYKPWDVPENFWVRAGQTKSSKVNISTLSDAQSAIVLVRTWNGQDGQAEPGQNHFTRVNSTYLPNYGNDHFYKFDMVSLNVSALTTGTNTITFNSESSHHGIEIMWPGPAIVVRYGSAPSGSAPVITQQPANQTVAVDQTATFTVGASGTSPLSYQWRKNGSNISGATGSSYTTPPVSSSDDGSTYSCVVTNSYGSATSNSAILTVSSDPPPPPPPPPPPSGDNVVSNPGFENGKTSWNFYTNSSGR
jgi:hypothetical protein